LERSASVTTGIEGRAAKATLFKATDVRCARKRHPLTDVGKLKGGIELDRAIKRLGVVARSFR
jgi:hypothetical protein